MRTNARGLLIAALTAAVGLAGCETTHHHESNYRAVSDSTISANVKAALVQDPQTRASNISVNTLDGTVELSGFVNAPEQRREAVRVAQNIDGVQSVKDELQVNDQGRVNGPVEGAADTDEAITHRVQSALASNSQTENARISVSTDDRVVQLAGFVASGDQRDEAGDVAGSVQGVRKVDNDLRIAPAD